METLMSGLMLIAFIVVGLIVGVICLAVAAVLTLITAVLCVGSVVAIVGLIVLFVGTLHSLWIRGRVATLDNERKANDSRKAADEATTKLTQAQAAAANAGRPIPAPATP